MIINILSAQDIPWFKGGGWYIIDTHHQFHGPFPTRPEAVHEEYRIERAFTIDPWTDAPYNP